MGGSRQDLTGKVFGGLTVIGPTGISNKKGRGWLCKCVCGKDKTTTTGQLTTGKTQSCGCFKTRARPIKHDLTGLRFGMLVAQYLLPKMDAASPNKWHCQCDCGKTFDAAHGALTSKHTESCGCRSSQNLDLTGQKFGRLVALERVRTNALRKGVWRCQCDCGNTTETTTGALQSGQTQSCGCLHIDTVKGIRKTHGATSEESETFSEYQIWAGMRQRCNNPNHVSYEYYGGRGITVCPEWESFEKFIADMGKKPYPYATLERVDNEKGYEPGNVAWMSRKRQMNNARNNRHVLAFGRKYTVAELFDDKAKPLGISYQSVIYRLNKGWDAERAATEPTRKIGRNHGRV